MTSLAELCDRLKNLYGSKFGMDNVKLIKDSNPVRQSFDILPKKYMY